MVQYIERYGYKVTTLPGRMIITTIVDDVRLCVQWWFTPLELQLMSHHSPIEDDTLCRDVVKWNVFDQFERLMKERAWEKN